MSEHEHYFHNNGFEFDVCACGMSFVEHAITLESTVADLKEALAKAERERDENRRLAEFRPEEQEILEALAVAVEIIGNGALVYCGWCSKLAIWRVYNPDEWEFACNDHKDEGIKRRGYPMPYLKNNRALEWISDPRIQRVLTDYEDRKGKR